MKVSVIIPVYNVADYVESCLSSALGQTWTNLEVVLVDDASPDQSMMVVHDLLKNHPKKESVCIISHTENQGLSAARNTGVRAASGEYVFFLDSDDTFPPDAIETLVNKVQDEQIDLVAGGYTFVGQTGQTYPLLHFDKDCLLKGRDVAACYFKKQYYEMACGKLIRKKLFTEEGCWFKEGLIHEDNLWSFEVALKARQLAICLQPVYNYHIHSNTITSVIKQRKFDSLILILNRMIDIAFSENLFVQYPELSGYLKNLEVVYLKNLMRYKSDKAIRTKNYEAILKIDQRYRSSLNGQLFPKFILCKYLMRISLCFR